VDRSRDSLPRAYRDQLEPNGAGRRRVKNSFQNEGSELALANGLRRQESL